MNGREKYFNTINVNTLFFQWSYVPVQDFALEEVGLQVQILAGLLLFLFAFFSFHLILPFGLFLLREIFLQ